MLSIVILITLGLIALVSIFGIIVAIALELDSLGTCCSFILMVTIAALYITYAIVRPVSAPYKEIKCNAFIVDTIILKSDTQKDTTYIIKYN